MPASITPENYTKWFNKFLIKFNYSYNLQVKQQLAHFKTNFATEQLTISNIYHLQQQLTQYACQGKINETATILFALKKSLGVEQTNSILEMIYFKDSVSSPLSNNDSIFSQAVAHGQSNYIDIIGNFFNSCFLVNNDIDN